MIVILERLPDYDQIKIMQKFILLSLSFLLSFLWSTYSNATHIVGGEISYECLGPSASTGIMQYKIVMHVYRDAFNGQAGFDNPAIIGIYTGPNSTNLHLRLPLRDPSIANIPIDLGNPCLIVPPNVQVEEAIYERIVELPYNPDGYWISYQRCCRNGTISNLNSPGGTGATYTIFLSDLAQQQCNNSPVFNDFPPIVICLNRDLEFDHSATDADGNRLVYELCAPFTGGGQMTGNGFNSPIPDPPAPPPYMSVVYGPGFNATHPMPASPNLTIDPNTGILRGFPTTRGQYSVGVCVKEYDAQGNLLSATLRDFQFNVTPCDNRVNASIAADSIDYINDIYYVNFCTDSTITFDNTSSIQAAITGYEWRFDLGNGNIVTSSSYQPSISFPGNGNYQGWLIANPGSTGCTDTSYLDINISVGLYADFSLSYDSCDIGPIYIENHSTSNNYSPISQYSWNFGNGSSNLREPQHQYTYPSDTGRQTIELTIKNTIGCLAIHRETINWTPKPIFPVDLPSERLCFPARIAFESPFYPIPGYTFEWDFGDGHQSNEVNAIHQYTDVGSYIKKLTITSPKGCTQSFSSTHTVLDTPSAAFSYNPTLPTSFNPTVNFIDESQFAVTWDWHFGNGANQINYTNEDVSYTYPDTGKQVVRLIVTHQSGCKDTTEQIIDIVPQFTYFLPNALTPNGDGRNDVYRGKGVLKYIKAFDLSIYNRWGEQLFHTTNPTEAWNGRKNNTGTKCQAGVYVAVVRITGPRGEQKEIKGYATIVY